MCKRNGTKTSQWREDPVHHLCLKFQGTQKRPTIVQRILFCTCKCRLGIFRVAKRIVLFVWNTFRFSNIIWCSKFDFYGLFVIIITFILLHQIWPVVLVHWSGHQSSHWMYLVPCSRRDILSWKTGTQKRPTIVQRILFCTCKCRLGIFRVAKRIVNAYFLIKQS
jgi:hypothetical protein